MYLLPMWFSAYSFLVLAVFGRHVGGKGASISATARITVGFLTSIYIFYEVCICRTVCYLTCLDRVNIELVNVHRGFVFDPLSASMLLVINMISSCAHIYSVEYMSAEPHRIRSISYPSPLTSLMPFLVLSDNALQLFVGREGVGICSYLLINFWYARIQANKASIPAVMANKIGDIALLLCCVALQLLYKSVDYATVFTCVECASTYDDTNAYILVDQLLSHADYQLTNYILGYDVGAGDVQALVTGHSVMLHCATAYNRLIRSCLVIAAVGKSAQAGLHMWLPEAMEGPTPVSSLIHAATMVTAGIFLIIRFSHLFHDIPSFFLLFIVVGSITASSSATIGLFQTDIKKVVAYSTRSQLGYMFVCRGFSAYTNSMFHPFNHAFFKALLFPTAGYIIHSVCDEQDVRKLGSFLKLLPVSYITLLIGSMSLVGFPFMSGFYSKDKIIELVSNNYWVTADIVGAYKYIVFAQPPRIFAAICTIVYSFKLLSNVFSNSFAGFRYYVAHVHFSPHILLLPLLALAIPSTCSGYVTPDMMVGIGSGFWQKAVHMDTSISAGDHDKSSFPLHTEYNKYVRYITLLRTVYFITTSTIMLVCLQRFAYNSMLGSVAWLKQLCAMILLKYAAIRRLLTLLSDKLFNVSHYTVYRLLDKGIVEPIGPYGIVCLLRNILFVQAKMQTGFVYHYAGLIPSASNRGVPLPFLTVYY